MNTLLKVSRTWRTAREEVRKTPFGFSFGFVCFLDVVFRLGEAIFGSHAASEPISFAGSQTGDQGGALFVPLMETVVFQIIICFVWHKLRSLFAGTRSSVKIVANTMFLIPAAYLTALNVFRLTRIRIISFLVHYAMFENYLFLAFLFSSVLISVLAHEDYVNAIVRRPANANRSFVDSVLPLIPL